MATTANYLFPAAQNAREIASTYSTGDIPIQIAINAVITTAITAGLFTTTIDLSSYSADQIQTQMLILEGLGYTVDYSVSTLTLNW